MGKFTSFVMNQGGREMTADQAAALAAADQAVTVGRTTVAPTTPTDQLGEQILQPAPEAAPTQTARATELSGLPIEPQAIESLTEDVGEQAGFAEASPEQAAQLYTEEVATQRKPRGVVDVAEGRITLPISSKNKSVGTITNNMARMEHAADQDMGVFLPGKVDTNFAVRALDKLGMAEGKVNPKSGSVSSSIMRPKQAFGGAAYLAFLIALHRQSNIDTAEQTSPEDPTAAPKKRQREGNKLHKIAFFDTVAEELEKLIIPTPESTIDPNTGEAVDAGYESTLSAAEKTALGDMIYRMASETGLVDPDYSSETKANAILQKASGTTEGVETFVFTNSGARLLRGAGVSSMIEQIAPGTKRKVTTTPNRQGLYAGEAATEQKRRTKVPDEAVSQISDTMLEAMDVMGTTPFIVQDHAVEMASDFLADIRDVEQRLEDAARKIAAEQGQTTPAAIRTIKAELAQQPEFQSPFARLFDVGYAEQAKLEAESARNASFKMTVIWNQEKGKWTSSKGNVLPDFQQAQLDEAYGEQKTKEPNFSTEHEVTPGTRKEDAKTHADFARSTIRMAMQKAENTVGDARTRSGYTQDQEGNWIRTGQPQVFYYGATAIGNSGRLMVSQTELNYQTNKLARFIVANPRATRVNIDANGMPSKAFQYVVARAMLSGADVLTPQALVQRFSDTRKDIDGVARAVFDVMQEAPGETRRAKLRGVMEQVYANNNFADEWEGTGEWGFILDALHEWGRFLDAKDNGRNQFYTRVSAEADGINNGSSIQGLQFGDRSILERAGVVYDFDAEPVGSDGTYASVIPEGNMRDFTMGVLFDGASPGKTVMADLNQDKALRDVNPNLAPAVAEMLPKIFNHDAMRKKFIKVPLMTTIYGKGSGGHADSAESFVSKYAGELGIAHDERAAFTDAFTKVISNALGNALNEPLVHQSLVKKQAGWLFNVMNVVPAIEGPNGYVWQAGGWDWVPDPEITVRASGKALIDTTFAKQVESPEGDLTRAEGKAPKGTITANVPIPSAAARKAVTEGAAKDVRRLEAERRKAEQDGDEALVRDIDFRIKKAQRDVQPFGEMTRNQLAVNGTHNIDSTVAQKTLIEARKTMGDKFWGGQVFDAFIGDVSSFETILDEGNKQFIEVNRNYNLIEAEYKAMQNAFDQFFELMDFLGSDVNLDISPAGRYRGVTSFIAEFGTASKAKNHIRGGHTALMAALNEAGIEVTQKTKAAKPTVKTKEVSPAQLKGLVKFLRSNFLSPKDVIVSEETGRLLTKDEQASAAGLPVDEAFRRNVKRVEAAKKEFLAEYRDKLGSSRQFN